MVRQRICYLPIIKPYAIEGEPTVFDEAKKLRPGNDKYVTEKPITTLLDLGIKP